MSSIKQFDLAGIGADVQFGKGGTYIQSAAGAFNMLSSTDLSTLVNVRVLDPVAAQDAATKNYVDLAVQGLSAKASVAVATTVASGNIDLTAGGLASIQGVTLVDGSRVLVQNQTLPAQNGIYIAHAGAWTRALDASTAADLVGAFVFVEGGTLANTGFTQTTNPITTLGTTPIVWVQFSGAGTYTAGAGLTLTGTSFSANTSGASTGIVSNDIVVLSTTTAGQVLRSTGTHTQEAVWGAIDLTSSNAVTGALTVTNGGTGQSSLLAHGVLVGEGTSGIASLAVGAANTVLLGQAGADPVFGAIDLTAMVSTSILPMANGGTNANLTASAGSVTYSTASGMAFNTAGTSGQVLQSNGTSAPSFVDMSTLVGVVGGINVANVGAGAGQVFDNITSGTINLRTMNAGSNKISINTETTLVDTVSFDIVEANLTLNNIGGTLSVAKGGTGQDFSGLAANNLIYTDTTGHFAALPISAYFQGLLTDSTQLAVQTSLALVPGTNIQAYNASLAALSGLGSNGILVYTGSNTFAERTITADTSAGEQGLHVTNGDGVSGNPTVGLNINGLSAAGALVDTNTLPMFDGTNNVKVTIAEIAAKALADYPTDPLFMYNNGLTATTVMTAALPTNARVGRICVEVLTAFGADGITITSAAGFLTADQVAAFVDMHTPGIYIIDLAASAVSSGAVTVTITGTGGSCNVNLNYNIIA